MNIAKFLRTAFFVEYLRWLLEPIFFSSNLQSLKTIVDAVFDELFEILKKYKKRIISIRISTSYCVIHRILLFCFLFPLALILTKISEDLINPFVPNAVFLYPLKISENRKGFGNEWVIQFYTIIICESIKAYQMAMLFLLQLIKLVKCMTLPKVLISGQRY